MISSIELAGIAAGFILQTTHVLAKVESRAEAIEQRDFAVPVEILPEGMDESASMLSAFQGGWPMFSESCGENAELTAPYKPRRLLLWWYLRWPWQCELLHWMTTCQADVCEGIRFFGVRGDPPFHVHAESYALTIRCDETLDHAGPRFSMSYGCKFERPGWYRCSGGPHREYYESDICSGGRYANCFPCASPADIRSRQQWMDTLPKYPRERINRRSP